MPVSGLKLRLEEPGVPAIHVSLVEAGRIGRGPTCRLVVQDPSVSREHLLLSMREGAWYAQDLGSANGTWHNGSRISELKLTAETLLRLGDGGTILQLSPEPASPGQGPAIAGRHRRRVERIIRRAAEPDSEGVREAIQEHIRHARTPLLVAIVVLVVVCLALGTLSWRQHQVLSDWRAQATRIFYLLKRAETTLALMPASQTRVQFAAALERNRQSYDALLEQNGSLQSYQTHEERLIVRIVRVFGECEVAVPVTFVNEVQERIKDWSTPSDPGHPEKRRFEEALRRAERAGHLPAIVRQLKARGLPTQFIYLALQESNFNLQAVGPSTRFGYAKGMWQFIPSTARELGLRIGPLVDDPVFDPLDERHNFELSTSAAADYLARLYVTGSQGSGLLVMARYNWGEGVVGRLIDRMPDDPEERNFWRLVERFREKIPDETYNYVLNIVAASVIGEDPRHFGFQRDNPVQGILAAGEQSDVATGSQ